ncbi:MAG: GPW/gp25 family protein [Chitinophaga sp.]|uniref:GPW/gp25 family protein n=1 Tax=Chitinophaga sp. TaxID=1869181 RepID=UPI0025B7B16B|nr:GPW/gp25 family protein [Chitinophaga sp.]MBV8255957.1 GPW/gp25 family protein [Chitinophaga sp.]
MNNIDKSFLGTGWNFPPTFRREWYGVEMATGDDVVRNSLEIIVATITGERIMLPNYGCNLQPHLFDQMNVPTVAMIEKVVNDALVYNEPRIIVNSVVATPNEAVGRLDINVDYTIITTNTRYNYVFPFYMQEATNIAH